MGLFKQEVIVRETRLDVFGHMNNAAYLQIFEEVRWDYISPRGFSMKEVQSSKTGPVILEVNLKFLHELRGRDKITVTVESMEYHGKVGKLRQQMIKEDGTLACEAIFTYGLFDLQARKLLLPTEAWKKALDLA